MGETGIRLREAAMNCCGSNTKKYIAESKVPASMTVPDKTPTSSTTAATLFSWLTKSAREGYTELRIEGLTVYGEKGSDGGPGLLFAIRKFIRTDPKWTVTDLTDDEITLDKNPQNRPELPPLAVQAWNYSKTRWRELWQGRRIAPPEVVEARLSTCYLCPARAVNRCSKCGCFLDLIPDDSLIEPGGPGKAVRLDETCPVGRWPLT